MWLERFPGDGDTLPDGITEWFGSFFPTVRYSNRSMKKLLELNNQGYHGYGEGFVPTVLNQCGMKITSFNIDLSIQRFNRSICSAQSSAACLFVGPIRATRHVLKDSL